jgi:hypothetical protein
MIIGNTTEDFTLLASCDSVYLRDHAKGFVTSCAIHKNNVHIHVTNPTEHDHKYLTFLGEGYKILYPEGSITTSYDTIDITKYTKDERKTFYACNRFVIGESVIKSDVLILDVDCYIRDNIGPFEGDVGLFFRTPIGKGWYKEGTKVAAGAVFCKYKHIDFLKTVTDIINENKLVWLVDQVALYEAYKKHPEKVFTKLDKKFLDWEFKQDSKIWTGKGPRKTSDRNYTEEHIKLKNIFPIDEIDYFK